MHAPELLHSYDEAIAALLEEIADTQAGERIELNVYIVEPGESSERVLAALRAAAERGVAVRINVDATASSLLSRLVERTGTLLPEARAMAKELPGLEAIGRKVPDHSKYALFLRDGRPSTILWGGINLGDRFRPWRDYAVRLKGDAAAELQRRLAGEGDTPYPPNAPLHFVVNAPPHRLFELRGIFDAIAQDARLTRLRVAMAYIDTQGAQVLRAALARGAEVELLLPQVANVYQHANMRTLEGLLSEDGLTAYLHPDMVHAKVLLAYDHTGPRRSLLGSANLKRNSFRMFQELDSLIDEPAFNASLDSALAELFAGAERIDEAPPYNLARALLEERLG